MKFDDRIKLYKQQLSNNDVVEEGKITRAITIAGVLSSLIGGSLSTSASSTKQQNSEIVQVDDSQQNQKDLQFIAKVLYSETSSLASLEEILLILSVIHNRINHKGFNNGKLKTALDVVKQPKAFSCIGDSKNSNWTQFKPDLNVYTKNSMNIVDNYLKGTLNKKLTPGVVYYHDKSISMPKGWDNKYWTPIKYKETPRFVFYTIKPKTK